MLQVVAFMLPAMMLLLHGRICGKPEGPQAAGFLTHRWGR